MKKKLGMLLSGLMLTAVIGLLPAFNKTVYAEDPLKCSKNCHTYTLNAEEKAMVISGEGDIYGSCGFKDIVGGKDVRTIKVSGNIGVGDSAFMNCNTLEIMRIEGSTYIGQGAFSGCYHLAIIELPDSIKNIDGEAFNGCSALSSITIPQNVNTIIDTAFKNCTQLSKITFKGSTPPDGLCNNLFTGTNSNGEE